MITARDVAFAYGSTPVLRGLSLDVAAGEVVALIGPSGSGKSTFLYCLGGILRPDRGDISIDGTNLEGLSEDELTDLRAKTCGYVLQFGRLIGELTSVENASIPLRLAGVARVEAERRAAGLLEQVGVAALAKRKVAALSGGEQQRVAIARALVHQPRIVYADEPTGALDSANSALVMDLLTSLSRAHGSSLLVVTHDDGIAQRADRIVSMRDGQIRETEDALT